tara:strand:- start:37374 stop:37775 length:402 start_codon:yes stop_codon:yes gene_type:complete
MEEVYLYFRTQATIGNDDAAADSCLFPLSSYAGMQSLGTGGSTIVTLYFKSMHNYDGMDQADDSVTISDSVQVTLTTGRTVKEFISDFTAKINDIASKQNRFLTVGDDLTGATEFFSTVIDRVGTIAIATAHS